MKNMILAIALAILFSLLNDFQLEMNHKLIDENIMEELETDERK